MIHELKTWTEYFDKIISGEKKFEVRKNDRNFKVGDTLILKEWVNHGMAGYYTGEEHTVSVSYILQGGQFGIEKDYIVMSIQ